MNKGKLYSNGKNNITNSTTANFIITNSTKNEDSSRSTNYDSDIIGCEICFEPFHPIKRPPKLLPCGHNICDQCIVSLCCHQKYYLLDVIKCPTCDTEFNSSAACRPPTNHVLCEKLKARKNHGKNNTDGNITAVHIPNGNDFTKMNNQRKIAKYCWRKKSGQQANFYQLLHCVDCSRKLNEKRHKEARFCVECFSSKTDDDNCLRIACLKCCVNRHNGHQLITFDDIENERHKLRNDLRIIQQSIQETSQRIEITLKELNENSMILSSDCKILRKAKQNLQSECEAHLKFALSVLKNDGMTILPPVVFNRMRQHHFYDNARLHRLLHFIEKYNELNIKRYNNDHMLTISIPNQLSPSSSITSDSKQQTFSVALQSSTSDQRFVMHLIAAVLTVEQENRKEAELVKKSLKILSKKNLTKAQRRAAILCCAKQLHTFFDETTSKQSLLLYIDAYLHIFYQLNHLIKRFSPLDNFDGEAKTATRWDVWKLIQVVYSDLMKYAAKHWDSKEDERVDLVDDLAFLCLLYFDVSDEATITICMIEAARARAAVSFTAVATTSLATATINHIMVESDANEQLTMKMRLNLIDEHLLECRRVKKMLHLRTAAASKPKKSNFPCWQIIKCFWLLLPSCFNKLTIQQEC